MPAVEMSVDDGVAEAEFFIRQGLLDEGIQSLLDLQRIHGDDPRITGRLNAARSLQRTKQGTTTPAPTPPAITPAPVSKASGLPTGLKPVALPTSGPKVDPLERLKKIGGRKKPGAQTQPVPQPEAKPAPKPAPKPTPVPEKDGEIAALPPPPTEAPVPEVPDLAAALAPRQAPPHDERPAPGDGETAAPPPAPPPVPTAAAASTAAEPVAAEPVAAEPVAAEPVTAEPVAAEPVAAEPAAPEAAPPSPLPAVETTVATQSGPTPAQRRKRMLLIAGIVASLAVLLLLVALILRKGGGDEKPDEHAASDTSMTPGDRADPEPRRAPPERRAAMDEPPRTRPRTDPGMTQPRRPDPAAPDRPTPRSTGMEPQPSARPEPRDEPPMPRTATPTGQVRLRLVIGPEKSTPVVIFRRKVYWGKQFETPGLAPVQQKELVRIKAKGYTTYEFWVTLDRTVERTIKLKSASKRMKLFKLGDMWPMRDR